MRSRRLSSVEPRPAGPGQQTPILIVDDEPLIRDTLAEYLTQEGFAVVTCGSAEEALDLAEQQRFAVALCDVQLPGMDGLALLERLQRSSPETFVLLITAYATVENAVEAFQRGAHDYLMKPILLDEVLVKIRRLLVHRELFLENQWLRRELNRDQSLQVIGASPAMQRVFEMVRKVAPTRSTVLLTGESGTGKEVIARAIHSASERGGSAREQRFVPINCAAIPHDLLENQLFGHRRGAFTGADRDHPGVFVHAGNGTVFLDEIGEMPLATQAKLLRVIEQKEILPVGAQEPVHVEARILAATNKDLKAAVETGQVPRGPVLSPECRVHSHTAAPRTARGHPGPGRFPAGAALADAGQAFLGSQPRGHADPAGLPLEGQRPRAGQRVAAGRYPGGGTADRADGFAAGPGSDRRRPGPGR